ncbi:MAG: 6,7-dimethyl-8-ribityllumazine synthase [Steroidobacteraceae bacterium]
MTNFRDVAAAVRRSDDARGLRVALIAARFNDVIVQPLIDGALEAWQRHGGEPSRCTVLRVPGAFELPLAARRFAQTGRFDAIVALGCVIRGDTPHFDFVAGESARGIAQAAYDTSVPVAFGVLTTENIEQAKARCAPGPANKGAEALETVIEMVLLLRQADAP